MFEENIFQRLIVYGKKRMCILYYYYVVERRFQKLSSLRCVRKRFSCTHLYTSKGFTLCNIVSREHTNSVENVYLLGIGTQYYFDEDVKKIQILNVWDFKDNLLNNFSWKIQINPPAVTVMTAHCLVFPCKSDQIYIS